MSRSLIVLIFALVPLTGLAQMAPAQPKSVRPAAPIDLGTESMSWATGVNYSYDGSGNIRWIGSDAFVYDAVGRLVLSDLAGVRSTYAYDAFGNRTACAQGAGDCQYGSVDAATNRLSTATYDAAGNVTSFYGHTYSYDAQNMAMRDGSAAKTQEYVYTADDERLAVYTVGGSWNWTVRDTSAKVLREFSSQNAVGGTVGSASWQWRKDYVWREGALLASRQTDPISGSITTYHYHVDHLGTPRRITDDQNRIVGIHDYYAYGQENSLGTNEPSLTSPKFTGHERDLAGNGSGPGTLDYMHARYYDAAVGRFLSVDPTWSSADRGTPQSWNRYAYVRNNPLRFVDPDGRVVQLSSAGNSQALEDFVVATLQKPDGRVAFEAVANDPNFTATMRDAKITGEAQIQMGIKMTGKANFDGGRTTAKIAVLNGKAVVNAADVKIDTARVKRWGPDTSGVTTVAHELVHTNTMRSGGNPAADDLPTNATGRAETEGRRVSAQPNALTKQQAQQLLQQLISAGSVRIVP